jgi:uncharacterized protein (TIGR02145 family)
MGKILFIPKKRNVITLIKNGLYYNWYAFTDARNITNVGWSIPSQTNFNTLVTYGGGNTVCGGKLKEVGLASWATPNTGATNIFGFNARGVSFRMDSGAWATTQINKEAIFWSTTVNNIVRANTLHLLYSDASSYTFFVVYQKAGTSVKIFRPATAGEQLLADGTPCANYVGNDGKIYRTTKIGTQVWLADNLAETKFRNGDAIPFAGANGINYSDTEWAALSSAGVCPWHNDWSTV